jgi:hypothetical protein
MTEPKLGDVEYISAALSNVNSASDHILDIPKLIHTNRFFKAFKNDPVKNIKDNNFEYKLFEKHMDLFKRREFNWDKSASSTDVNTLRQMTKMKGLTVLNANANESKDDPSFKIKTNAYYV